MIHNLKTWPEFFQAIVEGRKNFEVRKNDRNFKELDVVILSEWNPETMQYTGKTRKYTIGFMVSGAWGLEPGYCAFALLPNNDASSVQLAKDLHYDELKYPGESEDDYMRAINELLK